MILGTSNMILHVIRKEDIWQKWNMHFLKGTKVAKSLEIWFVGHRSNIFSLLYWALGN